MDEILAKLKLDAHHKIERFGVLFITLSLCLIITVVSIMIKTHNDNSHQLTAQAVYTTSVLMSRTGVSGSVQGVYTNDVHTKSFILIKFDDVTQISTNAANYQMFLTGSSLAAEPTHLNINPTGKIYMLGSTGYMGICLEEKKGFENQILDLVLRCNKEIVSVNSESAGANDGSFATYDQCRIYFNPGGSDATVAEFLNSDEFTVYNIYEELISRPKETELRNTLSADIETMKSDMDLISEYTERVKDDGIVLIDPPEAILGDVIKDGDGNVIASMDPSAELTKVSDDTVLYLDTDYAAAGGISFVWQDSYIRDGYLTKMMGDKTYLQCLADIKDTAGSDSFTTSELTWYRESGEIFEPDSLSQVDAAINADISGLTNAWNTYWEHKKTYQTGDLIDLLALESEVLESEGNFTMNDSENVLTNWQAK